MSLEEAAKTQGFTEETIRRWLRSSVDNAHTSPGELQRLRRQNQFLRELVGTLVFEREATKNISLARETLQQFPYLSKRSVAKEFGISRTTLYLERAA